MMNVHWIRNTWRHKLRSTFSKRNASPALPETICFVAATRLSEHEFWQKSPLGIGLKPLLAHQGISADVKFNNSDGLPAVYNSATQIADRVDIMVFLHDDIWLEDVDFIEKIRTAVQQFDIVGVAGNTRISKKQPAWLFRELKNNKFIWDHGHLSGLVRHGKPGKSEPSFYGPTPARCQLLDGVLLAARREYLLSSKIQFDERFRFHFYDMDFCRAARKAGLKLGTWPLDILHLSAGSFGTKDWREGYATYLEKWKR